MGKNNAQVAYEVLTAQGLSAAQATGVVGNLVIESNVSTTAVGDGGTSHGIAQWHNERWTRLLSWAKSKRRDPYDLNTQLAYLIRESQSIGVWEQLKSARTVQDASGLWVRLFERPKDQSTAAITRRANAGIKAVQGADTLPSTDITFGQGAKEAAGDLLSSAGDAVTGDLLSSAGDAVTGGVLKDAQPLAYRVLFVLLGVGLVGAGLYGAVMSKTPAGALAKASG